MLESAGTRPPTLFGGTPLRLLVVATFPTVMPAAAVPICWILADQPLARVARSAGLRVPLARLAALLKPGALAVPAPVTAASWSVWTRSLAVKRCRSSRAQPSSSRFQAPNSVTSSVMTASMTGKAVARYHGWRRSTLWIRGPVAGRRTGRPWLRLVFPLMATEVCCPFECGMEVRSLLGRLGRRQQLRRTPVLHHGTRRQHSRHRQRHQHQRELERQPEG